MTKKLTKTDLIKAFFRWTWFVQVNYNYERMQATGVINGLTPVLKKLYGDDKEAMKDALERHMQFFNTEPSFGGSILGVVIAMEEQKANGAEIPSEAINGFKTGLMGPIAGIGDTLWQGTLIPILLSFTIPFASQGNIIMGPIAFFVLHMAIMLSIAYFVWMKGYETGREGILEVMQSGLIDTVLSFSRVMGSMVIGALAAQFVTLSSPLEIPLGEGTISVQADILDQLLQGLLPLAVVLGAYYLLKKQYKPTTVLIFLVVVGLIGGGLGLLI